MIWHVLVFCLGSCVSCWMFFCRPINQKSNKIKMTFSKFNADDFRLERSMFVDKLWNGWIIAVHKIRECWRRMVNDTRRKNVMTEFSNVYSTYSMSEMFGYRSSRRVSNLQWTYDRKMIWRWNRQRNDGRRYSRVSRRYAKIKSMRLSMS